MSRIRSFPYALGVALLVPLLGGCASPALGQSGPNDRPQGQPQGLPQDPVRDLQPELLYVALQGEAKVAVIDVATLEEVARVDLTSFGFSENASPHHTVVEPDGSHWYVSLIAENRVLRLDRENRVVGQAEFEAPGLMALTPDGSRLYVGRSMMAANPPRSIGEIDTATMEVEVMDIFFPRPHALELAPGMNRVFSASLSQNQMASVDAESFQLELLNLEGPIHTVVQVAVSPDESTLVATTEMSGMLMVFDLADPAVPALARSIAVGSRPWHPVFERGTSRVWMGLKGDGEVVGVDIESGEVIARISDPSLLNPHGSAISADGRHLFISSNGPGGMPMMGDAAGHDAMDHDAHAGMDHADHAAGEAGAGDRPETGMLTVIDLQTREVVKVLEMGRNTTGIGLRRP